MIMQVADGHFEQRTTESDQAAARLYQQVDRSPWPARLVDEQRIIRYENEAMRTFAGAHPGRSCFSFCVAGFACIDCVGVLSQEIRQRCAGRFDAPGLGHLAMIARPVRLPDGAAAVVEEFHIVAPSSADTKRRSSHADANLGGRVGRRSEERPRHRAPRQRAVRGAVLRPVAL